MNPLPIAFALMAVIGFGGAMLVGALTHQQTQRQQRARDIYQAARQRGGVTAPNPFCSPDHPVNAPALVELHPRTRPPATLPDPPSHPWEHEQVPADEPVSTASVRPPRPLENTAESDFSSETSPPEKAQLIKLVKGGERRKTYLCQSVWGVKSGKVYQEALPLINQVLEEISADA